MPPIVLVRWTDVTSSPATWMDISEAAEVEPTAMQTTGHLIHDAGDYIIVAGTVSLDRTTAGDVNCIPTCLITDLRRLDS